VSLDVPGSETPALTVAIPSYNGRTHIGEALLSILAQRADGVAFHLLVVDDGSDDDTLAIVREVAGGVARIEKNAERLGLAGNWNRCVELAQTPWVAVFHQDDVMKPGHLAAHRAALQGYPDIGFVCGGFDVIDEMGNVVPAKVIERVDFGGDRYFALGEFVRELAVRNPVRCSTVTLNKAAHAAVGGFDARLRYALDWDFWARVARRFSVRWLNTPSVSVRWHPASETHRLRHGTDDLEEVARVIDHIFEVDASSWSDATALRRQAERRLARAYLNRAYEAACGGNVPLARRSLIEAFRRDKGVWLAIARDPRLGARLLGTLARLPFAPSMPTGQKGQP
jgi:glycosyltransferase involved in cell wall biosynthesis